MITNYQTIATLSNEELLFNLESLGYKENETTVEILLHLAEVEQRKLYVAAGYPSLFCYCVQGQLRYSEPAANRRISSARALSQFPELLPLLLSKEITLTTLSLASRILSTGNKEQIITAIKGKTRREVEEFLAQYHPQKQVREQIKPVVVKRSESKQDPSLPSLFDREQKQPTVKIPQTLNGSFSGECAAKNSANNLITQEKRYELKFSIGNDAMKKLEEAKALLSSKYPTGVRLEDILEEALELLLEKRSPERSKQRRTKRKRKTSRKHSQPQSQTSRHIPQQIRDEVYSRDQGCCTFVSNDGTRCSSRFDLELHHIHPFAKSGAHEPDNLTLRCRIHNAYSAEQDFGKSFIDSFRSKANSSFRLGQVNPKTLPSAKLTGT